MRIVFILFSVFVFIPKVIAKAPPDVQAIIDKFPDKILSLDIVLGKSYENSDEVQAIKAEAFGVESPYYQAKTAFDPRVTAGASHTKNESEFSSTFTPLETDKYNVGIRKYFISGTTLGLEYTNTISSLSDAGSSIISDAKNTEGKITLSQNIWKDFFGRQSRLKLIAGKEQKKAGQYMVQANLESWALQLINTYYLAWQAKLQVKATEDLVKRKKKLLDITKIKFKRGTAEKPDLLQVDSTHLDAAIRYRVAKQNLQMMWRELVLSVKLPRHWMEIDATYIPLKLDSPYERATELCQLSTGIKLSKKRSTLIKSLDAQLKAANSQYKNADQSFSPTLTIDGSLASKSTGVNTAERTSDIFKGENTGWTVALNLNMPIGFYEEKAQAATAYANLEKTKARASLAKSDHEVKWKNHCANLSLQIKNKNTRKVSYVNQLTRVKLEERRFGLGQIGTLNVIQAGDEATQAELNYIDSQIKVNQTSWEILKLNSEISGHLKKIYEKYKGITL